MCRLVLCNAATLRYLEEQFERASAALSVFFEELEESNGGHGNGIAALWMGAQPTTRLLKGRRLKVEQAATQLCAWAEQGADWFLFHTRLASAAPIASRHCHPFQAGDLVLAHNGHDRQWAALGQVAAEELTDSEVITRTWDALQLPLTALQEARGVFVGFQAGQPFAIKGSPWAELVAAHTPAGAILFASELPAWLEDVFPEVVKVGACVWTGGPVDLAALRRPPLLERPKEGRWRWLPPSAGASKTEEQR
jgi:hypothetical protein